MKDLYGPGFCYDLALDCHPAMPMQGLLYFVDAKMDGNRISHPAQRVVQGQGLPQAGAWK